MLWGVTLRSPHPYARIRSIDIGRGAGHARRLRGAHRTTTCPGSKLYGLEIADQPVLAIDAVRYQGEPVALVAADHPEIARQAAKKIRRRLRGLRAGDRRADALGHRDLVTTPGRQRGWDVPPAPGRQPRPAPASSARATRTRRADVVVDRRVRGRHAGPGVPRAGVRAGRAGRGRRRRPVRRHPVAARGPAPDLRGARACRRTRCGSRWPGSAARSAAARTCRCTCTPACSRCTPASRSRWSTTARSRSSGTCTGTRRDALRARRRPGRHAGLRQGADLPRRRRLRVQHARRSSATPARWASARTSCRTCTIDAYGAYTNNPPCGAMRGFGSVQAAFAHEAQMDQLAAELGMDPVELRVPQRDDARARRRRPGR